jgi:uncharacterized membrane protein
MKYRKQTNRIHLPESLYEALPVLYLALAAVLAAVASSAFDWLLIAGLVVAAFTVRRRRRTFRESRQWQRAAAFIDRLERSRKRLEDPRRPSTVEI